jgi:hypothetical protein
MQTISAFLEISSPKLTLAEMSKHLGAPDNGISFDKSRISRRAVWRLDSKVSETRPIDAHLRNLYRRAASRAKTAKRRFGAKVKISLNIGLFFNADSARAFSEMKSPSLAKFLPFVDCVEVSAYPYVKGK